MTYFTSASQSSVSESSLYFSTVLILSCSSFLLSSSAFFRSSSSLYLTKKKEKSIFQFSSDWISPPWPKIQAIQKTPYTWFVSSPCLEPCVCSPPVLFAVRGHHRQRQVDHRWVLWRHSDPRLVLVHSCDRALRFAIDAPPSDEHHLPVAL